VFETHLEKMDAKVLLRLGSPVVFLHGEVAHDAKAIPDGGESSGRFNKSPRRIRGCTKTLETARSQLPAGVPVGQLKVQESDATYQVIDHDIDGAWVLLYLAPVGVSQVDKSDENAFSF
jgi:hypothetical protein